ncbi:MAG TPA: alpha/beta hydrolase-fold protein [Phycisphaerales bacterium]|nr:alpha/beta hydrolase-fold protein [Phycisphaerales bacterium]
MHRARLVIVLALAVVLGAARADAQGEIHPESHSGGVLLVVRDKSGLAGSDAPLYLASNHVGWNPGDASMRLSGRSALCWQILLRGPLGGERLEFKFTRGSWETVEVGADLADIPNRTLAPVDAAGVEADKPIVVDLEVERFADERATSPEPRGRGSDAPRVTGKLVRVQVVGGAGAACGSVRDVLVWLPPGYDDDADASRRYPVLYMMDGQNVFDFRAPTPGEWRADETATELIERGEMEPIIIAAVPNSGPNRTVEYLPADALGVEGRGDEYLDWLVREVVPRVERAVRADGDAEARGIGGSSLGGLVALRGAQRHPGIFGRALAESAAIRLPESDLSATLFAEMRGYRARTFLGMGGREWGESEQERNAAWVEAAMAMAATLREHVGGASVELSVVAEHEHNEAAWAERLAGALAFLYPAERGDTARDR